MSLIDTPGPLHQFIDPTTDQLYIRHILYRLLLYIQNENPTTRQDLIDIAQEYRDFLVNAYQADGH